ncbi:VCBS repeat-containing protein [Planomonospora sp. ID67723]|uniref:FG-GAP repeat domain-containing protein n=1 Tax=Planomonospora sp. ID67723 TaxID=2738134 RepID=UPI0018C3ADF3|nr:VCBS repeat-containing protein [Planomonospora sp. ID67723]MBG0830648.1 VCBS repeat-containing protein [Planomonospora sp. ID67723]
MKLNHLVSGTLSLMAAAALGLAGAAVTTVTAAPAHASAAAARAASTPGGQITRSEVLARAQNWVDRAVRYNLTRRSDTLYTDVEGDNRYGPDCSGLVSMAWHITANSGKGGNSTDDFESWSGKHYLGSLHDLKPGDAILKSGHIELFARWKNPADHSQGAWTYSLNGGDDRDGDGWRDDWAKGPTANSHGQVGSESWSGLQSYRPIRYNNIIDDLAAPPSQDSSVGQASGDFNGDGRTDSAMMYRHADGSIQLYTSLANANGDFTPFTGSYTVPAAAGWDWNAFKLLAGDYNGDHRADLAIMYRHTDGSISMHTSRASTSGAFASFTSAYTVPAAAGWDWNAIRLVSGDANGDGRADAVMMYRHADGSIQLYTSLANANGDFTPFTGSYTVPAAAGWDWNAFKLLAGDYNGDHRADLAIMYRHTDGSISMHTSRASTSGAFASFTSAYTVPAAAGWDWNAIRLVSGDANGDGRADAVMMYRHADGSIQLYTSLANANGDFTPFTGSYTVPAAAGWDWNAFKLLAGDYNGDHRADLAIMYRHTDGSISMHTSRASTSGAFASFTSAYTVPAAAGWDWNAIRLV